MHRRHRQVAIIAAVASNGVIGANNRMPWHLPEDLRRFKAITLGHAIIMGRRTWEALGAPLAQRQNIVVTEEPLQTPAGITEAHTFQEALERAALPDPVFVIGGERLYRSALPIAQRLYITQIHQHFVGNIYFPTMDYSQWREIYREQRRGSPSGPAFDFVEYVRIENR